MIQPTREKCIYSRPTPSTRHLSSLLYLPPSPHPTLSASTYIHCPYTLRAGFLTYRTRTVQHTLGHSRYPSQLRPQQQHVGSTVRSLRLHQTPLPSSSSFWIRMSNEATSRHVDRKLRLDQGQGARSSRGESWERGIMGEMKHVMPGRAVVKIRDNSANGRSEHADGP